MFNNIKTAAEIAAEQLEIDTKLATAQAKIDGFDYAISGTDYTVSLTEENQNGLASVMAGANLAEANSASIFPLNFNAVNAGGVITLPFSTKSDFETFALEFMTRRQVFFA